MFTKSFPFLRPKAQSQSLPVFPYMTAEEVETVKSIFRNFEPGRPLRIFEYGAGGSTIYFSRFLKESAVSFQWISLEHDLEWARHVTGLINSHKLATTQLLVCQIPGHPPRKVNRWKTRKQLLDKGVRFDYSNYTDVPGRLGTGFDLVLVDGRDRKNCVNHAFPLLNPGGSVLLHDAEREYYQCLFRKYPQGVHLCPRLWVLKKEP